MKIQKNKIFGFWIYLMSDCIIFATLFAVYIVLSKNNSENFFNKDIFKLKFIFFETILLLISSLTCGLIDFGIRENNKKTVKKFLLLTFLFGFMFIVMELYEFYQLILENFSPKKNAFFSAFFTLIGTHGLHVIIGLLWILLLIYQTHLNGLTITNCTRIICLNMFWHFLDLIWVFVFTIVYLLGSI